MLLAAKAEALPALETANLLRNIFNYNLQYFGICGKSV